MIPPLFVCLSFFHFFLQLYNIFILTTFPLRLFLFFLSNFLRICVHARQCRTIYFTTPISISSVNHFEHICSGCRQSLATRDLIKSTLRHIYAALSSNIRIFLSLVKISDFFTNISHPGVHISFFLQLRVITSVCFFLIELTAAGSLHMLVEFLEL